VAHEIALTETLLETLEQFEAQNAERIIDKLEDIGDFPGHVFDRLKNNLGYKLRVGDFRVLVDWDKHSKTLYAIGAFEQKTGYHELGKYRDIMTARRKPASSAREEPTTRYTNPPR
jgi:mRNA interferase RelE/StbE